MHTMRIALMLLLQPVLLRRTMGKPWLQWLMLAIAAGATVLAIRLQAKPIAGLACMAGAGLLGVWWVLLLISNGLQFMQSGTRLLPRLRRIALATTVLVWLCLILIITLAVGGVFGHHALWALAAGWGLAAMALLVAGRDTLGFIALAPLPLLLNKFHDAAQIAAPLATPAGMVVGAALLGGAMCYALRLLMGKHIGDVADSRFLQRWNHMVRGTQPELGKVMKPFSAIYASCLRRDCARRDQQNLLMHALGTSLHWTGTLSFQLPLLLVSAAFYLVPALNPGQSLGIIAGSMLASLSILPGGVARIAAGQPEQALVRLAPGMPAPNALNRMLARGLLRLFFRSWVATMGCAALLLALAGVAHTAIVDFMSSMSVTVLLAAAMLLNFALANKGRDGLLMGLLYVLTFVLTFSLMLAIPLAPIGIAALGLQAPAPGVLRLGMLSVTLVILLLAGLFVWWRWRTMLAAPPAFPAARIGPLQINRNKKT